MLHNSTLGMLALLQLKEILYSDASSYCSTLKLLLVYFYVSDLSTYIPTSINLLCIWEYFLNLLEYSTSWPIAWLIATTQRVVSEKRDRNNHLCQSTEEDSHISRSVYEITRLPLECCWHLDLNMDLLVILSTL
jgi:hypothetical protein